MDVKEGAGAAPRKEQSEGGRGREGWQDTVREMNLCRITSTDRPTERTMEERTNERRPQEVNNVPLTRIHPRGNARYAQRCRRFWTDLLSDTLATCK